LGHCILEHLCCLLLGVELLEEVLLLKVVNDGGRGLVVGDQSLRRENVCEFKLFPFFFFFPLGRTFFIVSSLSSARPLVAARLLRRCSMVSSLQWK